MLERHFSPRSTKKDVKGTQSWLDLKDHHENYFKHEWLKWVYKVKVQFRQPTPPTSFEKKSLNLELNIFWVSFITTLL